MVEGAEEHTLQPRDLARNMVLDLIRQHPAYSFSDIRGIVGAHYPRKFATGPVFEYILDRILGEYVRPKLGKNDATELRQKKIQFQIKEIEKARIDDLTGLPRRKLFTEMLTLETQRHKQWTFLLLDLDNFKRCNTIYGLEGGDLALRTIAALLKSTLNNGAESIIGRWGGEEFVIAIPGEMNGLDDRISLLRQAYQQAVRTIFVKSDEEFQGTLSIGRYDHDFTGGDVPIGEIVSRADDALYIAKTTGKNRTVAWTKTTPPRPGKVS